MYRAHNFSAGPAAIPDEVLEAVRDELFDYAGTGTSVMEMSHRSEVFREIAFQTEQDLREVLNIPEYYKVLFVQGGASLQFSQVPMNILGNRLTADYIHTGLWSGKAIKAAKKYCDVRVVSSSENTKFDRIPDLSSIPLNSAAAYLHYTENETVQGVQFLSPPRNATTPLVCDACSSLMSKTFNIEAHGLIYAAAQKNMGAAGITVVIVSPELLDKASHATPDILNYSAIADANSMLNTPPTFAWYLTGLTLKWIKSKGGLCSIQKTNNHKANSLYATIDNSGGFYSNKVVEKYRSKTNIPFFLREQQLEQIFLSEAKAAGLVGLKGHSTTGGLRASIYNAVAPQAVEALASFMKEFAHRYG